jgi:hypothetical protein
MPQLRGNEPILGLNNRGKKKYKARLFVKGFSQKKGIDFDEIFFHVFKMTSIRTILSLVAVEYFHLEQLNVEEEKIATFQREREFGMHVEEELVGIWYLKIEI